ncbi:hypothetical protein [Modestobacter sp. SYSU DS0290]
MHTYERNGVPPAPAAGHPRQAAGHRPAQGGQPSLGSVVSEVLGQVRSSGHSGYGHKRRKQSFRGELFG